MLYKFNVISIKISAGYFRYWQDNSKIYIEMGKPRIAKSIWKKKIQVGRLTVPNYVTYFEVNIIKTMWYWHKGRHTTG